MKLKVKRHFTIPVMVDYFDETGEEKVEEIKVTFKVLPSPEQRGIEEVLVKIHDLELFDEDGQPVPDDLINIAAANDPDLARVLRRAYIEATFGKKPRTTT